MPEEIIHQKHRLSSFQIIISGFVGVILLGALLLMLPVSSAEGCITPFNETLFTATSAVCCHLDLWCRIPEAIGQASARLSFLH